MEPVQLFTIAAILLDVYAIGRAVLRHHGVATTFAWMLAIVALPGVGAAAYLLAASPFLPRRRAIKRRARIESLAPDPPRGAEPVDPSGLLGLCARLTGFPATTGNRVRFLGEADDAFATLEAALAEASTSIWAEYYIIKNDETGMRFLDLLIDRARAGVQVRLLYDAVGSSGLDGKRLRALTAAGGRAHAFLPVNPLARRWSVHLRNHRKLVVVDGVRGFTGGMNVGDEYSGRGRRRGGPHFRDAFLEVGGPAVDDLALVFAEDWAYAVEEVLEMPYASQRQPGGCAMAILTSGPDQRQNAHALAYFAALALARRRILLTSPYFVPDAPIIRALTSAALRGVDVRILLPAAAHMDVRLVGWASRGYFAPLLAAGVRLFEYRVSMLHAKTLVVDDFIGVVGSANVDIRSMRLNFEVSAVMTDPVFLETLAQRFAADEGDSDEVTMEYVKGFGLPRRLGHGVARLMSPLL